jgi:hypothetical protein
MDRTAEARQRLWIVPGPLVIWALHFMLSYVTAALWCGRFGGRLEPLAAAHGLLAAYTGAALLAIGAIGRMAYKAHAHGAAEPPHDADSPADRYRFVGFAALLVSGLSAIAVLFTALSAMLIESCS